MTIEELEKKLSEFEDLRNELKTQIAKLKEQNEEKPTLPHPRWRPIFNENYYYICEIGEVREHIWDEDGQDQALYSAGNVFMSEDAAKFAAERLKVLAEMREWAGKWDDPYALVYNHLLSPGNKIQVVERYGVYFHLGEMRFASKEDAENCIKAVGYDRLIKYYFGAEEG